MFSRSLKSSIISLLLPLCLFGCQENKVIVTPPSQISNPPTLANSASSTVTTTPTVIATITLTPTITITPTIFLSPTPIITPTLTPTPTTIIEENIKCTLANDTLVAMNQAGIGNALSVDDVLKPVCMVNPGVYNEDLTLEAANVYVLLGNMQIGNDDKSAEQTKDTKLTIEAGTTIVGTSKDAIVIARDGQLFANGTAAAPIVMTHIDELILGDDFLTQTTEDDEVIVQRGLWGGLIINGYATTNRGPNLEGEGFSGKYAGSKDDDNSGSINYLVVKYAGYNYTSENELNGIALQGVGNGTVIDYVQVHNSFDDGIEFFGGTVNVKHLVLTGNSDDSLDWADGWRGNAQYVYIEQIAGGDKGIEADSSKTEGTQPRSNPQISNLTIVAEDDNRAIEVRYDTNAQFHNAVVTTTGKCVDFDDANDVNFSNSIMECGTNVSFADDNSEVGADNALADVIDANSVEFFAATADDESSIDSITFTDHAASATAQVTPHQDLTSINFFFDDADYFGAVEAGNDWTQGWTQPW